MLEQVDIAMKSAYGESVYDDGYRWLREAIMDCATIQEVRALLTDANFHDAVSELEAEILTPSEKLKAVRATARRLQAAIGRVVLHDDETTDNMLVEAQMCALEILFTRHDGDVKDMLDAVKEYFA